MLWSHIINHVRLILPEARSLSLLWKELDSMTSKPTSIKTKRMLVKVAWTLYMPLTEVLCYVRCAERFKLRAYRLSHDISLTKDFTLDITIIAEVHNHLRFQGTWRAKNPLYSSPQSFCASSWLKFSRETDPPHCAHVIKYCHCLSLRYCNPSRGTPEMRSPDYYVQAQLTGSEASRSTLALRSIVSLCFLIQRLSAYVKASILTSIR